MRKANNEAQILLKKKDMELNSLKKEFEGS